MNLPNKITLSRLFLSLIVMIILIFPFDTVGISLPKLFINELLVVDIKYIIAGIIFVIASVTDFLDGFIARKYNMVTDLGKMLDAIVDKVLVNGVLILLATSGFIHPIIPVIIVVRDTIVDTIRMVASSKGKVVAASILGKIKTILMTCGISLTLFYNLPFELINIKVSDILIVIACIMSIISAIEYYKMNKQFITEN
ncbi:MAG: CDP-diacylglycerol--glycerol-3-phosphate 3-phosphatidyltransferase [Clostridium sp.]|nr:CDP-diacylglycerol--glycerol-3-phosphate 3-phosphatidyltransferase [Clostridium sp.]MCM1444238.1 CDP-diacylglycerol--glycerol-3-phosphate 3-phosphatidyltransferase [Candidatus Amulumruptor caecigallinarius]